MAEVVVERLVWDAWNIAHIARHDVTPDEVEEVCQGEFWSSETHSGRLRIVGPAASGNLLTVILAPQQEQGAYYVVTARPASRKERRGYRELKAGGGSQ
jgi:uncharacterized DUF497 family protein